MRLCDVSRKIDAIWFPLLAASLITLSVRSNPVNADNATDTPVPAAERAMLVNAIATKLKQEYVFPDVAEKMSDAIQTHADQRQYESIKSAQLLAEKLTADLREVSHDKHLRVIYHAEGAPDERIQPSAEEARSFEAAAARDNFYFDKVVHMDGNIGYIEFEAFVAPAIAGETANAAMSFLANTDALIIDLRKNRGGDPEMVAFMASYLFDNRTHLNDIYVRKGDQFEQYWTAPNPAGRVFGGKKPVYILTSHETFSGAEDFTYALKNLKRATVVGEVTRGGAHPTRSFKVSDHFVVAIPFARAISPITHSDWEGAGVTPDVIVPSEDALKTAYNAALESVIKATIDAEQKEN
jgi:hypothetical protein